MSNDRLRDVLARQGVTPDGIAEALQVDPKTVERWITKGRAPYPRHRHKIAAMLGESERYLWPDAYSAEKTVNAARSELVTLYPHRNAVPSDLWGRLLAQAENEISVVVYVGMFLTETPGLLKTLRAKGKAGGRVRLMFGNPTGREVMRRSEDEGIGKGAIPAKVRNALAYFHSLDGAPGVEIRCHATTLYNSIFRYDEEMIVNPHIYGFGAPHAPALHLRRLTGGDLFDTYVQSFERVWDAARPPKW
jgi:lambda repressor-like predicted transcriptional regulator